jgi:NADPH:quinone reductase-like Zn-dependent oxidoreductase
MQAVTISTFGGPDVLRVAAVAVPEPGPGQVRVKVRAAAVHPVDLAIRAGAFAELLPGQPRYVLGWDVAGTVDAVGAQVTAFRPGDAVVGLSVWLRSLAGTQAEFVVLDAARVAAAPEGASWVEAATLPLNALAAVQALNLMPQGTRSVAITGAAGAVGGFAAELAVHRGQPVYAVASAQDETFVRGLSAVFVPRSADPAGAIRAAADGPVDAVLDAAGIGGAALGAVRDGGTLVTTIPPTAPPAERDIRSAGRGQRRPARRAGRPGRAGEADPSRRADLPSSGRGAGARPAGEGRRPRAPGSRPLTRTSQRRRRGRAA